MCLNTFSNNAGINKAQPYKYQSIELEKHFGLEQYETFYRGLDPQLGRFTQVDPLADIFTYQSPYASMDNNPVSNTDPDGSYSRFGAWWRNIAWGGNGTEKDNKTGEWGVNYAQTDGKTGEFTIHFQTKGSRVENLNELRDRKIADMKQFQWEQDNGIVKMTERGYVRTIDGTSIDEPISDISRAKSLVNMLEPATINSAPGALKVPGAVNEIGKTEKGLNFTVATAERMTNPDRAVPVQILKQAIETTEGVMDPKGSRALLHTTEMWKNGKLYNLKVLYDKATNAVWHFHYESIKTN